MSGHHLEIVPLSRHRWVISYEGDQVAPSDVQGPHVEP
jgi:hypothetical protein